MKIPNGLLASVALQCIHPTTGEGGDFLFSGDSHRDPDSIVSPVFNDLQELWDWARLNNWESVGGRFRYNGTAQSHGDKVSAYVAERYPNVI